MERGHQWTMAGNMRSLLLSAALLFCVSAFGAQTGSTIGELTGTTPVIDWSTQLYKYWVLSGNSTPTYANVPTDATRVQGLWIIIVQPAGHTYTIATNGMQWQGATWSALDSNTTNNFILQWNGKLGLVEAFWVEQPNASSIAGGGNVFGTGTPVTTAVPVYSGTTGTNIVPSTVTIDGSGNIVSPTTITIGSTNVAGSLAGKQPSFTTGSGVTNISNVLFGTYTPGAYTTFTTNSGGSVSIESLPSWNFNVSGTTSNATTISIYTNTLLPSAMSGFLAHVTCASDITSDSTNSAYMVRQAAYRNGSSTVTIGTNALSNIPGSPGVACGFTRTGTNVFLQVTGISGHTINWNARGFIYQTTFSDITFYLLDGAGGFILDGAGGNIEVNH